MAESKPKLIPVKVPWSIALAAPDLYLEATESERTVKFIARFLPNEDGNDEKVVTLTFEGGTWAMVQPAFTDRMVIDESNYDYSEVSRTEDIELFDEWYEEFIKVWKASGICPDPRMYEIQNSEGFGYFVDRTYLANYKHLLILGEDIYIEILCKNWNWTAGEWIDWSKSSD